MGPEKEIVIDFIRLYLYLGGFTVLLGIGAGIAALLERCKPIDPADLNEHQRASWMHLTKGS